MFELIPLKFCANAETQHIQAANRIESFGIRNVFDM
jgi:hypothetical protein